MDGKSMAGFRQDARAVEEKNQSKKGYSFGSCVYLCRYYCIRRLSYFPTSQCGMLKDESEVERNENVQYFID